MATTTARAVWLFVLASAVSTAWAGPNTITYQGCVLRPDGSAVTNEAYRMRFRIFDAVTAGTQRWEEIDAAVPVTSGLFSATLGDGTAFGSLFAAYPNLWLEVAIDLNKNGSFEANEVYAPRQKMAGAAWATDADTLDGRHANQLGDWLLTGNAGTTSGTSFLGTTDNKPLDLRVNNVRALRLEYNAGSPNVTGGYSGNTIAAGVRGGTIAGGGASGSSINRVTADYATVGGGSYNTAGSYSATVGGGYRNAASSNYATVAGGYRNAASSNYATVAGGYRNTASSYTATVGGGYSNTASGQQATVGGGKNNTASKDGATIGGGYLNTASKQYATVGGGYVNTGSGYWATVAGGTNNTASNSYATVAGGNNNTASGYYATVAGGNNNTASGYWATVGGGEGNTASGNFATVPGGSGNRASGSYSFAAGWHANANNHSGSFTWADCSTPNDFYANCNNAFGVRASGGVYLYTNSTCTVGSWLAAGSGSWASVSDRNQKENVAAVNAGEVLEKLAAIPISTWNYKSEDRSIRHMGPMAQDLYAAFGLGDSDKAISTIDADGVALAGIQALYKMVKDKNTQIAAQQQRIADLETRLAAVETMMTTLAAGKKF